MSDAPKLSSLANRLARSFSKHRGILLATLLIGCILSFGTYFLARSWEKSRTRESFAHAAEDHISAVRAKLAMHLLTIETLAVDFAQGEVTRQQFRASAAFLLGKGLPTTALVWAPRVAGGDHLAKFVDNARNDGLRQFRVTELDSDGFIVPANDRPDYFPVLFFEPCDDANSRALGYDLASEPARREAMIRALKTGQPAATRRVKLVQQQANPQDGFLVFVPIFRLACAETSDPPVPREIRGYVVGVFRLDELLTEALAQAKPAGIDVHFFDLACRPGSQHVFSRRAQLGTGLPPDPPMSPQAVPAGMSLTATLDVAGRTWQIACVPAPGVFLTAKTSQPWVLLAGGLLMTLIFVGGLWRAHLTNTVLESELTERHKAQGQLTLAARVFENSSESIVITDAENRIVSVNQAFTDMVGYGRDEVIGQNPRILQSDRHDPAFYERMWDAIINDGGWQGEIWNRRKSGDVFPQWLSITTVRDGHGKVANFIGLASDMTRRKQTEERIQTLAYYDALTGLPNRSLLKDRLQQAIVRARRSGKQVGLMFLDLDRFKNINDSLGHHAGDLLLQEVAQRLKGVLREQDTVARMGGDEFVIVLPDTRQPQDASMVGRRINEVMGQPFAIEGHELRVRVSIGISTFPDNGQDIDTLMKSADAAMYVCKENGQSLYQFFTQDMNTKAYEQLIVENELRKAIDNGELVLHFQPQVEADGGRVIGAEALVRWNHPTKGLIQPAKFIPVAEQSDLIVRIGQWVLRTACRVNSRWMRNSRLAPVPIAVNISAVQFRQADFHDTVLQALAESGLEPRYLELELTESAIIQNADAAVKIMKALRKTGVLLSIDDFGTGYSNLSYLKRYPLHKLKIDRSLIRDLATDPDDAAIVRAIVSMSKSLNLMVLAEGVETRDQLDFLRDQGCDQIQGFFLSPAVAEDQFADLLTCGRTLQPA